MRVLLSIKPNYVRDIMKGTKKYEYRRKIFKRNDVDTIVIYATKPVGKVVGEFKIKSIISNSPDVIWSETSEYGGLNKEKFYKYFQGLDTAFAIQIYKVKKYSSQISLSDLKEKNINPPQSFIYLDD